MSDWLKFIGFFAGLTVVSALMFAMSLCYTNPVIFPFWKSFWQGLMAFSVLSIFLMLFFIFTKPK